MPSPQTIQHRSDQNLPEYGFISVRWQSVAGQLKRDDGVHNKSKIKEVGAKIQILPRKEDNWMLLTLRQATRSKRNALQPHASHEKDLKARKRSHSFLLRQRLQQMLRRAAKGRIADQKRAGQHSRAPALHQLPLRWILLQAGNKRPMEDLHAKSQAMLQQSQHVTIF